MSPIVAVVLFGRMICSMLIFTDRYEPEPKATTFQTNFLKINTNFAKRKLYFSLFSLAKTQKNKLWPLKKLIVVVCIYFWHFLSEHFELMCILLCETRTSCKFTWHSFHVNNKLDAILCLYLARRLPELIRKTTQNTRHMKWDWDTHSHNSYLCI